MADNATSTQSADVIGVYDASFNQLFPNARPLKASVTEVNKLMEHPIESGSSVTDFKVRMPVEIELAMLLVSEDYTDVYKAIKAAFVGNNTIIVQTRADVYKNMLIQAMPHEESAEIVDGMTLALKLKEVILISVQFQALPPRKVKSQKDTSVLDRGEQTPQGSVAYRLFGGGK